MYLLTLRALAATTAGVVGSTGVVLGLLVFSGASVETSLRWLPTGTALGAAFMGPPYLGVAAVSGFLGRWNHRGVAILVGALLPITWLIFLGFAFQESPTVQDTFLWFSAPFLVTPMLIGMCIAVFMASSEAGDI